MEARLQPCLALPLNEEELNNVTDKAKDWAIMHGKIKLFIVNVLLSILHFYSYIFLHFLLYSFILKFIFI